MKVTARLIWIMCGVVLLATTAACGPTDYMQVLCTLDSQGNLESNLLGDRLFADTVPQPVGVGATLSLELREGTPSGESGEDLPSCSGAIPDHYQSVESTNPDVLAVENNEEFTSTFDLVGKSPGEATVIVTNQDGSTFERQFNVAEIDEIRFDVQRDPYLASLRRTDDQSVPERLAVLPDARLSIAIQRLDSEGQGVLGEQEIGISVDGDATVSNADDVEDTATLLAGSEAGSFEITTTIGGSRTIDIVSLADVVGFELWGRTSFTEYYGPLGDGETLETDLIAPDFELQLLPRTSEGRYVHGTADAPITVELLEGDEDFILPESDEFGFDGESQTEVKRHSLSFDLYLEEGAGTEARIRLGWLEHDLEFQLVTQAR